MDGPNVSLNGPATTEVKELLPANLPYLLSEIIVAIFAVLGNALTLYVFALDRKLRRLTNYYIASLALADLLVGVLGVPFAILTSLGLPRSLWACLLMLSFLVVLCTISIFCLVAVSIDRYWAILYPLVYSRIMTSKMARRIIVLCWFLGTLIGLLPVFGWHNEEEGICLFTHIMDYDFLVFLYFVTIVGPGVLMSFFYAHIYSVVLKQLRHIASQEKQTTVDAENVSLADTKSHLLKEGCPRTAKSNPFSVQSLRHSFKCVTCFSGRREEDKEGGTSSAANNPKGTSTSSSCRCVGPNDSTSPLFNPQLSKPIGKEIKAAKNLSIIVIFFFFCWFPLYTINCIQAFCTKCTVPIELMHFTIILSHANSAINPLLYAYHMKDFRRALEFHVLQRLGFTRFKRSNDGTMSLHYSTVLNVNVTPTSTMTRSPSPFLAPSLAPSFSPAPSPGPVRLLRPDRSTSSLIPNLSTSQLKSKASSCGDRWLQMSLDTEHRRPLNSTFSWPPSMFSRSLVSHQSLLESETSLSSLRRVRSAEPLAGIQFPPLNNSNDPPNLEPKPVVNRRQKVPFFDCDSFDSGISRAMITLKIKPDRSRCKSSFFPKTGVNEELLSKNQYQSYRPVSLLIGTSSNRRNSCDGFLMDNDIQPRTEPLREICIPSLPALKSKSHHNLFESCKKIVQKEPGSQDPNNVGLREESCSLISRSDSRLNNHFPSTRKSSRDNFLSKVMKKE